jgi:hypothetical protein
MSTTIDQPLGRAEPLALPCGGRLGVWFSAAAALAFASSLLVRTLSMPVGLKYAVMLLPAPALVGLILSVRRMSDRLDELQRRIQLEAFAAAFGVAMIGFIAYGQLNILGVLGPEDWIFPWLAVYIGYFYGLQSARKRYT